MEQQIFGLMAVAEEQQKGIAAAIEELKAERQEMRRLFQKEVDSLLVHVLDAAVEKSVDAFAARTGALTKEVNTACKAVGDVLEKTNTRHLMYIAKASALAFVVLFLLLVAGAAHTSYLRKELTELRAERVQLEANVANLAARGGRIKITTCTDSDGAVRLCIPVSTNQSAAHRSFKAPYADPDGVQLVIPRGY
jgi:hypothetical protein